MRSFFALLAVLFIVPAAGATPDVFDAHETTIEAAADVAPLAAPAVEAEAEVAAVPDICYQALVRIGSDGRIKEIVIVEVPCPE